MIHHFANDRCALLEGRAEDTFSMFAPKSVGLVLTDPPYSEHTHRNLGREQRHDGHEVRNSLEFPPLTDGQLEFFAREFVRLCTGWILIFTDDRGVSPWGTALERAGGRWVRTGAWVKSNPMPQMQGDRPSMGMEMIVIGHAFPPGKGRMEWRGGGRAATWRGPRDKDGFHPNQKPLWLMQELAGLFAPPGATVLDPFMGSGSTGVAALMPGRAPGSQTLPKRKGGGAALALTRKERKLPQAEQDTLTAYYAAEAAAAPLEPAPMPEALSFVGIDGDTTHCATATRRIQEIFV